MSVESSCVEVGVPSVVYNDYVCGVGLWEFSVFGGS